jgi:KaiC/GvpD/RAD55 family RecA-like ATPase
MIKGVLPRATLGVLFGESGSGKSFITLDMCIAIARGQPWRGKRTKQGRVVYIVAEGAAGFRNRVIAYLKHYGIDPAMVTLDIINDTPSLLLKDDAQALIKAIHATGEPPALVVIDTLAQSMAGANENASEDMGKALAHCKGIHKSTGAMVLLVHHSGKDSSKGARGWSGMRAAADVELEVTRSVQGRALRTTKQKDGADFEAWGFDLEVVNIGEDEDGDQITSCVVVEAAVPNKDKTDPVLGEIEQVILNVMSELGLEQTSGIERKAVVDLAMLSFPEIKDKGQIKAKRNSIRRSLKKFYEGDDAIYSLETDDTLTILDSE